MSALIRKLLFPGLILIALLLLTACSDSSTGEGQGGGISGTGMTNMRITDAPIDNATSVVVSFTGIEIQPEDGALLTLQFDEPQAIDLLQLQGTHSAALLENQPLAAGNYSWIRLQADLQHDGIFDSFIEFDEGTRKELKLPSNNQNSLLINMPFTLNDQETLNLIIDFDLRKSLTDNNSNTVTIKPVLRAVREEQSGTIEGTIAPELIAAECDNPEKPGVVYLFNKSSLSTGQTINLNSAITSTLVAYQEQQYRYTLGYITAGDYSLLYSCNTTTTTQQVGTAHSPVTVVAGAQSTISF